VRREKISHGEKKGESGKSEQKMQTPLTPKWPVGTPKRRGRNDTPPEKPQECTRKRTGTNVTHLRDNPFSKVQAGICLF